LLNQPNKKQEISIMDAQEWVHLMVHEAESGHTLVDFREKISPKVHILLFVLRKNRENASFSTQQVERSSRLTDKGTHESD
jgi:hypothetical protein